jgi:serine/threonine protein kinase
MTTGMPPWKEKGFTNPISLFNHIKRQTGPPRMEHPGSPSFTSRQKTMWHMLEELVRKCFDQDSDKRPTVKQVQDDPFFLSIHDCDDDQTQCLGLFSPRSGGLTLGSPSSPKMMSPTIASPPLRSAEKQWRKASPAASSTSKAAAPLSRSKSLVQWKSTFVSPPRQKTRSSPNPARKSPAPRSPAPNTSEWPEWARKELKKQQHQRLPMQTPHKEVQDLQTLMDSLALSEGTNSFQAQNSLNKKLASAGTTISTSMNKSQLIGLAVLENEEDEENQSKDTYEI